MNPGADAPTIPLEPVDPARVRSLFDEAVKLPPADRAAFVRQACQGDLNLEAEVRALMAYENLPPAEPPERTALGRFQITGKLGQGGMGIVYRGHDPVLRRDVALKLVTRAGPEARVRLVREAHAMARVAHPNVVPVYEVGTVDEQVFVAMELVEGSTLSAWLRASPRGWREIVRHLVDAGRGLAAAHRAGLLHRDFKPDNILIGADGRARVIDFGLARAGGAPSQDGPLAQGLTRQGAIAGTPGFMSPEHFDGTLTPLADQWSFAVTAYFALFGALPFWASTLAEIQTAVNGGAVVVPPLGALPVEVADAVVRGMSRHPEDRFATLDAMLDRLEAVLHDPHTEAATSRRQRRRLAIGVGGLAILNFVIGGLRTDFAFDFGVSGALLQGAIGIGVLVGCAATMRGALWRTRHDRRVLSLLLLVIGAVTAHRAVMLDAEVVTVLRGDAVIALALMALGALTIERWFLASAALMVAFLAVSFAIPVATVPTFGLALIATLALGIWFWREPPLPPHLSASRTGSSDPASSHR